MPTNLSDVKGAVAIIPAAGTGSRMQSETPKQYLSLNGKTVLEVTLDKFLTFDAVELVVLVVSPEDKRCFQLPVIENDKLIVIEGGQERVDSVLNGLKYLYDLGLPDDTLVMVHDAARPCVNQDDLQKMLDTFNKNGLPLLLANTIVDTIQGLDDSGTVSGVVDRNKMVRALTPQAAKFVDLIDSVKYSAANNLKVTDEVSALIANGKTVEVVFGKNDNIKITYQEDLALAEYYLSLQT